MASEEERRRDKLIYEIIVERFKLEWKRTNDLDSKANNVTGFAGLLATLNGGIVAGITEIIPQMPYKHLFVIPLIIFVLSAVFGLLAYWLESFSVINPEAMIQEYSDGTETEVLRTYVATTSFLTMFNLQRNNWKMRLLYVAFVLLVVAIGLFFVFTIVNMML